MYQQKDERKKSNHIQKNEEKVFMTKGICITKKNERKKVIFK